MLWLPINTLRLDSTHPDTYNLVGFSGCLHLWWIPLLDPELLISELCVTSITMNPISPTTRLALNEFQASCYSHHRSQSALSETNWLLRASGCNLTLNLYLVIQMGHHHGHPLTGTMGLRPDHWSATLKVSPRGPKELYTDTNKIQSYSPIRFTMQGCIHYVNLQSRYISHFQVQPIPTHHSPFMFIKYNSSHFHVTLVIPISFSSHAKNHTKPII